MIIEGDLPETNGTGRYAHQPACFAFCSNELKNRCVRAVYAGRTARVEVG
jgi:hypothetical protein